MFKRKIYSKILTWKEECNGSRAILIEGARRIGKSTIVRDFVNREYRTNIFIDFTEASSLVRSLFDDISNLDYLFLQLQLQYGVELHKRESAIVFDEVQLCPKARQAIKKLVSDGRYDYIETGSLISIKKNVKDILVPSEERRLQMFPMDYEEFLWAMGDNITCTMLRHAFEEGISLGESVHRKLMRDFRLYMLVGGMPQAVSQYIESNNFYHVDQVKRDIISLYQEDFRKIDSTGRMTKIFSSIPAQLNSNASRYNVSGVMPGNRANNIISLLAEMEDSKTVLVSYHVNDPNIGLTSNIDLNRFKLFMADTGLFVTQMFHDKDFTENIIYNKLLSGKLSANLGYLFENIIAQMLTMNGYNLFYHTFFNEKSRHNYEIDFLLSNKNKICPIEVKSSGYKTHASLDAFAKKYSSRIDTQYIAYTKDYHRDGEIKYIPVYMIPFL